MPSGRPPTSSPSPRLSRRQFGLGLLAALSTLSTSAVARAEASAGGCVSEPGGGAARPAADPALAAGLPAPFSFEPWRGDRPALTRRVADVVARQAGEVGAPSCFRDKAARAANRIEFLSPFEFLVVTYYDSDLATRDALLDQYARNPRAALHAIQQVYPSPRAEMILRMPAYYDLDSDRVRVNLGMLGEEQAPRVLVHELWHNLPNVRVWTAEDGTAFRATGFWTEQRKPGEATWRPIDDPAGLPFQPYLLDEAMASLMETRFAGPPRRPRPDVVAAQQFLARLLEAAGSGEVMRLYLESRPAEFAALVAQTRTEDGT